MIENHYFKAVRLYYFIINIFVLFIIKEEYNNCKKIIDYFIIINFLFQLFIHVCTYSENLTKAELYLISSAPMILTSLLLPYHSEGDEFCRDIDKIFKAEGLFLAVTSIYYLVILITSFF